MGGLRNKLFLFSSSTGVMGRAWGEQCSTSDFLGGPWRILSFAQACEVLLGREAELVGSRRKLYMRRF